MFPLGIETTVSSCRSLSAVALRRTPAEQRHSVLGGGVNWHRYTETSDFAGAGDDVPFTNTGFQVLGGAEWRAVALGGASPARAAG